MNTDRPQARRFSDPEHPSDEMISTYLDGEATEAERLAVSRHLPACEVCTSRLEEQREISDLLRALPAVPAPRSFALPSEEANPAIAWFRWMRLCAAFATFAFVAIFAFNLTYMATNADHLALAVPEQAVELESEMLSDMAAPASSEAQSAPPAKMVTESEEAAESSEPAPAEMAVVLESEAVSTMTPAPASSPDQSAPRAKMVTESEEAAESTAPPAAEMAATFEAQDSPASPVSGLEWVMLAVAIVLSFSAFGIWLLRIRR